MAIRCIGERWSALDSSCWYSRGLLLSWARRSGGGRMRKANDFFIALIAGASALISVGILLGLVFVVAQRGIPALSWSFFTEQIRLVGAAGGILWNLIGTSILLVSAFVICAPMAVGLALVERVWLTGASSRRTLR